MKIRVMTAMLMFALSATALYAQTPKDTHDAQFTIKVASAEVHKAPTTASPVVGQATQGSVLLVTRELGSWVRVPWPPGPDGVAYVHVSTGSLSHGSVADTSYISADVARTSASAFSSQSAASSASANPRPAPHASQQSQYVGLPNHTMGAGVVMTTDHLTFGGSGRFWLARHIAAQVQLTHQSFTNADNDFRTISFLPSAVVRMRDHVSDYLSMRPYVGGGLSIASMTMQPPDVAVASSSKTVMGVQFFGGAELTFASVPQVGVSFDVGYRHAGESFEGVDASGLAVSGAAHWYFR